MKTIFKSVFFITALALVMTACQKETDNINVSLKSSVTPTLVDPWQSGNAAFECQAAGSACAYSYKWNSDPEGEATFPIGPSAEGAPNGAILTPDGNTITILNSDGKTFDWSSEWPVCKVIVKAGTGALIYTYNDGAQGDAGLVAPGGKDISHVTFCYSEPVEECEWVGHTAFGGENAGAGSAWWFYFDSSIEEPQPIYAGQMLVEGASVYIDESNNLVIELGSNLKLQDITFSDNVNKKTGLVTTVENNEQVKVQGYVVLPVSRPSAGLFTFYKGRDLTIPLGETVMPFYVIHLDVELKVCPEPEV